MIEYKPQGVKEKDLPKAERTHKEKYLYIKDEV